MRRLILGGGSNQLELIKKSYERKDYIVLVDYLEDCPGKVYADVHLKISTFDIESVVKACKEYQIDSVVTAGTDQPVYTAAVASKHCTLPFYISEQTALNVTNKKFMKETFQKHHIKATKHCFITPEFCENDLQDMCFPVVMKPVDAQGQRGIFLVNELSEIKKNMSETLSFSREDYVLIEEYYDNDEITVNGWVNDGHLSILSVVDRITIDDQKHIGICLAHNHPSLHLENYSLEIQDITSKIVKAFNIKNGPIYFQYLIGERGLVVNEIACRVGGAYEGITIPYLTGFDILEAVLDYPDKASIEVDDGFFYKTKRYLSTQLFFGEEGFINSIHGDKSISQNGDVLAYGLNFKEGDIIPALENAKARVGYFITKGKSHSDMIGNVESVFKTLQFNKENLIKNYLSYKNRYKYVKEDL